MSPEEAQLIEASLTAVVGCAVTGMWAYLAKFVNEQRKVNKANVLANRSMQRDVIMRYFRQVVEHGEPMTIDEMQHLENVYAAYHANGGNAVGTRMYDKIIEHVHIITDIDKRSKDELESMD